MMEAMEEPSKEYPRSPRSTPPSQRKYWIISGSFRPRDWRRASTFSLLAESISGLTMKLMGSIPVSCSPKYTIKLISSSMGIIMSSFLAINFSILSLQSYLKAGGGAFCV